MFHSFCSNGIYRGRISVVSIMQKMHDMGSISAKTLQDWALTKTKKREGQKDTNIDSLCMRGTAAWLVLLAILHVVSTYEITDAKTVHL